jgi:hypothetical protein
VEEQLHAGGARSGDAVDDDERALGADVDHGADLGFGRIVLRNVEVPNMPAPDITRVSSPMKR